MLTERSVRGHAAVVGSGAMGTGIAALIAGTGWTVRLLDVASADASGPGGRNAITLAGIERLRTAKPPILYAPEHAARIVIGNIEDDAKSLAEADWIIEAAAERLDVKQSVMRLIDENARGDALIGTNTSGLSLSAIAAGRSKQFRRRFLGTHFFNPPRHVSLLELIRLPETDSDTALGFESFAKGVLGRRVVWARDTPGFISNRIGMWHLYDCIHAAEDRGMSVDEVDYLTGPLIGRPRTATFRLADMIGFDVMQDIARSQFDRLPADPHRDRLLAPRSLAALTARGDRGDKSGAGYYRRVANQVESLDLGTYDYRQRLSVQIEEVETLLGLPLAQRLERLPDFAGTRWGGYLNAILNSLDRYVRLVGPEIAGDVLAIDRVMQWGFNWRMGPFEIGDHLRRASDEPAHYGERTGTRVFRVFGRSQLAPIPTDADRIDLPDLKKRGREVLSCEFGSLIDIGDGCGCIEFHGKMNTLSAPLSDFILRSVDTASQKFTALVVGNQGRHFSAGFDLKSFLDYAGAKDWAGIERLLETLQRAFLALKYVPIPVVAAPFGFTLGGGCECVLQCDAAQAAAELAIGLPEVKVGLLPAGGGTTEMLVRHQVQSAHQSDPFVAALKAFEAVISGAVTTSAFEAESAGLLRPSDGMTLNSDRLLHDAKRRALGLSDGYLPPAPTAFRVAGRPGLARLDTIIQERSRSGALSEHDRFIAQRVAWVLTGGDLNSAGMVGEEHLLRLEREAFIELLKTQKSQERIRFTLETGKHLEN